MIPNYFYIMLALVLFACNNDRKEIPRPVLKITPKNIPLKYSITSGKEYFDKHFLTVEVEQNPENQIEIKWKYQEGAQIKEKYGDDLIFSLEIPATGKSKVPAHQYKKTIGLLGTVWEETYELNLFDLHAFKKGKQQIALRLKFVSESTKKTIAETVISLSLDIPAIHKTIVAVRDMELTEAGCQDIGDEDFILGSKKVYPDLMIMMYDEYRNDLYKSETSKTTKNLCKLNKEFLADIYHYQTKNKLIIMLYDEDYGFNPSDKIADWEFDLSKLSNDVYQNYAATPKQFYDVKKNPVAVFNVKGKYMGVVN